MKNFERMPFPEGDLGVYANAMYDTAFKKIFLNREITMDLINCYIPERKIADLEFVNTEMLGDSDADRRATVDVICTDDKGAKFVVEMQKASQKNFRERMIFYASRIISTLPEAKGRKWNYMIPNVYVLAFTAFSFTDVIKNKDMKDTFVLNYVTREKNTGDEMPHAPEYFFFDLKRFNKKVEEIAKSPEKWLFLLRNSSNLKDMPKEFKGDAAVEQYFSVSQLAAFSDEEREQYLNDMRNEWDIANEKAFIRKEGHDEGVAEGIAKGASQEKNKIARAMLADGADLSLISKYTGLSEEQIKALKN